ncbi:MAG: hypothetical protein R2746_12340 [Acidimicrobiales bacterium]
MVAAVLGAVVLASMWPLAWKRSNGGVDALLGAGADSTARPLIDREVPGAVRFAPLGHDGQQFYVVARHPFDPAAAAPLLDSPTYRPAHRLPRPRRRAGAHGGPRLVWAMLAVSLAAWRWAPGPSLASPMRRRGCRSWWGSPPAWAWRSRSRSVTPSPPGSPSPPWPPPCATGGRG